MMVQAWKEQEDNFTENLERRVHFWKKNPESLVPDYDETRCSFSMDRTTNTEMYLSDAI